MDKLTTKSQDVKAGTSQTTKRLHFFVAQYWADALAKGSNAELAAKFAPVAKDLQRQ
ncbi:MAG: NADP-dependent isocitrate dehydrogenase [Sulfurovum sp.]|nr:NADP-dependent isocitrate dehydrogenase [Sulfurovum sp.]